MLSNVSYEDEGWYTCIAGNSLGVTYASAYLHVVDSKLSHFLVFYCWQYWDTFGLSSCNFSICLHEIIWWWIIGVRSCFVFAFYPNILCLSPVISLVLRLSYRIHVSACHEFCWKLPMHETYFIPNHTWFNLQLRITTLSHIHCSVIKVN
jgi:hypothetical protein